MDELRERIRSLNEEFDAVAKGSEREQALFIASKFWKGMTEIKNGLPAFEGQPGYEELKDEARALAERGVRFFYPTRRRLSKKS